MGSEWAVSLEVAMDRTAMDGPTYSDVRFGSAISSSPVFVFPGAGPW